MKQELEPAPKQVYIQLGAGEYGTHTWCDSPTDWENEVGPYILQNPQTQEENDA